MSESEIKILMWVTGIMALLVAAFELCRASYRYGFSAALRLDDDIIAARGETPLNRQKEEPK